MARNYFDLEKALNTLLYVVQQLGQPDYYQAFRTLYVAEKDYLVGYGASLLAEDHFVRMKDGPVPSRMYDFVRFLTGQHDGHGYPDGIVKKVKESIATVAPHYITVKRFADLDYLAEAEQRVLTSAVAKCKKLDAPSLRGLAKDAAFTAAKEGQVIDPVAMAKAAGANADELAYLKEALSNNYYASV